jgi:hypothetical protein
MLQSTIGKQYEDLTKDNKLTVTGLLGQDKVYGNFVSSYDLPDGSKVMRHLDRYKSAGNSISGMGLPINVGQQETAYRIFYFKVDSTGIVRDWASAFYNEASQDCIGVAGIGLDYCGSTKNALQPEKMDGMVRTSTGQPIGSWAAAM